MLSKKSRETLLVAGLLTVAPASHADDAPAKVAAVPTVDADGTVHVPATAVPLSSYMSEEAKRAFIDLAVNRPPVDMSSIERYRKTMDEHFYAPRVERARKAYPVAIEQRVIAGVRTDVVTPKEGVTPRNRRRVLINLHGGGFRIGAGLGGVLESIPIAGSGGIKVVSVDYRQGPEYRFPAASEDVAAVYRELLKEYPAANIGIYGCSAGGVLTAMTVAWLQKEQLPRPGAVGIFCAGADGNFGGDSRYLNQALDPFMRAAAPPVEPNPPRFTMPYLDGIDLNDPLVSPVTSPAMLAKFPPTMLATGTRALELGSAINTHRRLLRAGVVAELNVWEGMWHGFMNDVTLPESIEMYAATVQFFDRYLGH